MTVRHGDRIDETGFPQVCNFDKDPDLYFNCGPGAHSRAPQGAAQLLQGARRRARAVHQRQPQCLGAGRRDVRRQAGPRARIHDRHARLRRGAHGQVPEARTIHGAADEGRLRPPARIPQVPRQSRPELQIHRLQQRGPRGARLHEPGRAQEAARRPRAAEVEVHADHELRRNGRSGRDDDGAGRRHGSRAARVPAQGRPPGAARVAGADDQGAAQGRRSHLPAQRRVRHRERGLRAQLHPDALARRHRAQLPEGIRRGPHRHSARQTVQDRPADEGTLLGEAKASTAAFPGRCRTSSRSGIRRMASTARKAWCSARTRSIRDAGEKFARLAPADRFKLAIAQGEKIHPGYGSYVETRRERCVAPDEPHARLRGAVG